MCGRYNLRTPAKDLARIFDLADRVELTPRYNIAPTQSVAVIRGEDGRRAMSLLHWGLIPSWADDPKIGNRLINARAETAATKPSFRSAFRRRRCLIPADGFYEWKKGPGRQKQPFHIGLADGSPFAFAGLWEHWQRGDADPIDSCTILTTQANERLREVHDRMPVILDKDVRGVWLDPDTGSDALQSLLVPFPADGLKLYPVSTLVNSPANDVPECVEPA